jgi:hypothetical protein
MRLAVILSITAGISAVTGARAADPFSGDWKLNLAKSESKDSPKAGRVLIEPDYAGGYRQFYELIFEAASPIRLVVTRSQFDGEAEGGTFNGRDVACTSHRIDANSFEITYRSLDTNQIVGTMRFSATPRDTLTVVTAGDAKPRAKSVV